MANKRQKKKQSKKATQKTSIRGLKQTEIDEFRKRKKYVQNKLRRIHKEFGNKVVIMIKERDEKGNIKKNGEVYYREVEPEFLMNTPKLEDFKSKKELKDWLDRARKFTDRSYKRFQFSKNEEGVIASKQVLERANQNSDIAIESAKKLIESKKNIELEGGRQTIGERLPMMGKPNVGGFTVPKEFDFENVPSQKRLIEKLERLEKRRKKAEYFKWRNGVYKDNFMLRIERTFNSLGQDVVDMLRFMKEDDLFDLSLRPEFEHAFDINEYGSDGNKNNDTEHLERLREYLSEYYLDGIDFDLKNFPNG